MIEINQDSLGKQAARVVHDISSHGVKDIWAGALSNNRMVVILFNQGSKSEDFTFSLKNTLGIPEGSYVSIRDVVLKKDLGLFREDSVTFKDIHSHSVLNLVLTIYPAEVQI